MPILTPDEICERLRELLAQATARPWTAFDESGVRAIMKGKRPPSGESGYPSRRWQEIVAWTGFDASDVAKRYRSPNLHLIVEAVNALPSLLDLIQQQQAAIERLSAALEESYSALRHVYEHGVKPRPQWVGEVFNKAYERARADLGKDAGDE